VYCTNGFIPESVRAFLCWSFAVSPLKWPSLLLLGKIQPSFEKYTFPAQREYFAGPETLIKNDRGTVSPLLWTCAQVLIFLLFEKYAVSLPLSCCQRDLHRPSQLAPLKRKVQSAAQGAQSTIDA
jgi:hypothetical protein